MSTDLSWLPDLVLLNAYGGQWGKYIEAVYEFFKRDFIYTAPTWPGRRWGLKRMPMRDGKEATFWHIVSEGADESSRLLDQRRCEHIRWPRAIIDAFQTGRVKCWRNRRKKEERVVLAVDDFSYVVVLAERGKYILLWTAYPVERPHRRRKLEREYANYQTIQKG